MNHLLESPVTDIESNAAWYALQVRSRREFYVSSQIQGHGFECFLPTYKNIRKWSDRMKEVEQPLFPGYLFCRFDFQSRRPVVTTPGVIQIVGFGRVATPLADEEIKALQVAVSSGVAKQPWPFLELGEKVEIESGPLRGLEGVLLEFKGNRRLILSVSLLRRSVAVEIDSAVVRSRRNSFLPSGPQLYTQAPARKVLAAC